MGENPFPEAELEEWAEGSYSNKADAYAQELKRAHLKAIKERNTEGLKRLSRVMFVQLSRLRTESPEKWKALDDLYRELIGWLNQRGS